MTVEIVPYETRWHDALLAIWYRAVERTHLFLSKEDLAFYHEMLRGGALQQGEVWVAVLDGEPLAFLTLNDAHIDMLFVEPDHHGQGIGRQLLAHAEQLKGLPLDVDVNEQNEGARAFYARYGFEQIGRSELDGTGRPFPILHLRYGAQ